MANENTSTATQIARLRAAAALIPAIEADLANSKLSTDRAALMSEFCQWAYDSCDSACEESQRLSKQVSDGLARLKVKTATRLI